MLCVYSKSHKRSCNTERKGLFVFRLHRSKDCVDPIDCIKQQCFDTNSTGKTLDVNQPENSPKKAVINWASLRENRAKYEAMKWAG